MGCAIRLVVADAEREAALGVSWLSLGYPANQQSGHAQRAATARS